MGPRSACHVVSRIVWAVEYLSLLAIASIDGLAVIFRGVAAEKGISMIQVRFSLKALLVIVSMFAAYFAGRVTREIPAQGKLNLKVPVTCNFDKMPLREVVAELGDQANISVRMDDDRFSEQLIDFHVSEPIQFKSALYLALSSFDGLSYYVSNRVVVIDDEATASLMRQAMRRTNRPLRPIRECNW